MGWRVGPTLRTVSVLLEDALPQHPLTRLEALALSLCLPRRNGRGAISRPSRLCA